MSNKEQTPSNVGRSLVIIVAAIVIGTVWYAFAAKDNTDKILKNTKQATETPTNTQTDEYKGWKSYSWDNHSVSFKYPSGWTVKEDAKMDRLYVRNSDVNLLKEATPADFQQLWLSRDVDETSAAREAKIKNGESDYRVVQGEVKASTIKAGSTTINVYEYTTVGGPTLEAYWTNKDGHRLYATNSTEVGEENQTDMVANLKKLLASVTP